VRIAKHRSLGLLVVLAMTVSVLLPAGAVAKKQLPNYKPIAAPAWVTSPTPDFSHLDTTPPSNSAAKSSKSKAGGTPTYGEGDQVIGLSLNDATGYFATYFTVRAIGEHIEVWVQNNPNFPSGDPRNDVVVTDEQIAYLVDQFDNNIYPKESEFWREPAERTGANAVLDDIFGLDPDAYMSTDGKDRVIAMISNVRDDNYYDPNFPVYIAGFFSSTINAYLDRNVITIDAYDWGNRVGPEGSPWRPADGTANDRPYLYEGTFAHEYQHLLHADQNPGEESWVNEGLSDWTEWLVGYGIPNGHWDTAQEYAENSLVIWGDQGQSTEILADYGEAFMFMHYLYGKYGEAAMQALFQNQGFGIAGFNAALASIGANDTFADMYHDFAIARLVLANKGNYRLADIPSQVILNEEAYSTPGAPPWGSDYLKITNPKGVKSIMFDGVDQLTKDTAWTSVADPLATNGDVLWSGTGDEVDRFAIFETTGGGTLTFDTLYDIEEQWDFGFVQVSTDDGATWTSLSNGDTRSDIVSDGYPAIMDQLGEGFTGDSGGWVSESFDLSAYSGDILVGFRFMTDWGTNGNGTLDDPNWYVDNVAVDGSPISDGSDASVFKDVSFYQPTKTDFTVDLVSLPREGSIGNSSFKVLHLITDDATEMASASQLRRLMRNSSLLVLVVTYDAPQGVADYAPYDVTIQY
jgi:immune inhibitor A